MGVQWSNESFFKKEMDKWDAPKRLGGYNRDGFLKFPLMLYRPQPHPLSPGKYEVAIQRDVLSLDKTTVILDAQAFNSTCQLVVKSEEELERAKRDGWRESQAEAMVAHEHEIERVAKEAAHRNWDDRNMGEKAQAEIKKAEEATSQHVPEVKEQPRKRKQRSDKGKPRKIVQG